MFAMFLYLYVLDIVGKSLPPTVHSFSNKVAFAAAQADIAMGNWPISFQNLNFFY